MGYLFDGWYWLLVVYFLVSWPFGHDFCFFCFFVVDNWESLMIIISYLLLITSSWHHQHDISVANYTLVN